MLLAAKVAAGGGNGSQVGIARAGLGGPKACRVGKVPPGGKIPVPDRDMEGGRGVFVGFWVGVGSTKMLVG